jgi:hypothetical protein
VGRAGDSLRAALRRWGQGVRDIRARTRRTRRATLGVLVLGAGLLSGRGEPATPLLRIPGGTLEMGSSPDEVRAAFAWCQRVPGDPED